MNVTTVWETEIADDIYGWNGQEIWTCAVGDTIHRVTEVTIDGVVNGDWYAKIVVGKADNEIRLWIGHEHWDDPCWLGTEVYETVSEAVEVFEATVADIEGNN